MTNEEKRNGELQFRRMWIGFLILWLIAGGLVGFVRMERQVPGYPIVTTMDSVWSFAYYFVTGIGLTIIFALGVCFALGFCWLILASFLDVTEKISLSLFQESSLKNVFTLFCVLVGAVLSTYALVEEQGAPIKKEREMVSFGVAMAQSMEFLTDEGFDADEVIEMYQDRKTVEQCYREDFRDDYR